MTRVPFSMAKDTAITAFEVLYLTELLKEACGNVSRAARLANMDRMYLIRLCQKHGLQRNPRGRPVGSKRKAPGPAKGHRGSLFARFCF